MNSNPYRDLPSVDRLVADRRIPHDLGDAVLVDVARRVLTDARASVASGEPAPSYDALVEELAARARQEMAPPLRPLVNATGVVIHTNLGRAPLAQEAIQAMAEISAGYSNLEYDTERGARGSRHSLLEPLLCRLTGAEAGMAVNNNASAVLLTLSALAARREVIVSRGQLVEIGGGFRIPDVMRQSRARLVEVGTTNRTRVDDFAGVIGERTAAVMRVHPSNFRILGFTETPGIDELAGLARQHGVALLDDLGSGCLLDTAKYGLAHEPTPQDSISAGADVVMFSGDKLLGGPQGGLIVGRRDFVEKLKRHPLARAVRLDKASIAGLAATLRIYLEGKAEEKIPVWRMIAVRRDDLERRAAAMVRTIGEAAEIVESHSMIGGGSLPEEGLTGPVVAVSAPDGVNASELAARLRARSIVPRVEDGRVLLDPRTVDPSEDAAVAEAVRASLA